MINSIISQKISNYSINMKQFSTIHKTAASEPSAPQIKLEPARSTLHPGDSIVVNCQSSTPESPVVWKREGNRRLPSNFHVSLH